MATVIPFKGIRPAKDKVHIVTSRPYDNYSKEELYENLSRNPYSFLHVINPDYADKQHTAPGSFERLVKIKNKFNEFCNKQILITDDAPCFYIYRQQKGNDTFTGIIGCSSIDDYFKGIIKVHEQTITEREEKLMHYLDVCNFNAEPVLFSYPNDAIIDEVTARIICTDPEYDYTTTDKVQHTLWLVCEPGIIKVIQDQFKQIPAIYIADGHHRSASSALLGKALRKENPNYTGNELYNFFLGIYFPKSQLKIYDFNRVVKNLNGLSQKDFLKKIAEKFEVENKQSKLYKPTCKHNFSLYMNNNWYSLTPKKGIVNDAEPVGSLDASILSEQILSPVLNIHDLKTDRRIGFVPGTKGMEELKKQVDEGTAKAAFGLYPVSMDQLKLIADTNNIMPPKTTWIEPKLRNGLVIYRLN